MEIITFTCPHCGKSFRIKSEFVGKRILCPACHEPALVAAPAEPQSEVTVPPPEPVPPPAPEPAAPVPPPAEEGEYASRPARRILVKRPQARPAGVRTQQEVASARAQMSGLDALACRDEFRRHVGEEVTKVIAEMKVEGQEKGLKTSDVVDALVDATEKAFPTRLQKLGDGSLTREQRIQSLVQMVRQQGVTADEVACAAGASKAALCYWVYGVVGCIGLVVLNAILLAIASAAMNRSSIIGFQMYVTPIVSMAWNVLMMYLGVRSGGSRGLLRVIAGFVTVALVGSLIAWGVYKYKEWSYQREFEQYQQSWRSTSW